MEWTRILAYITGTVDQELLLRNEYLADARMSLLRAFVWHDASLLCFNCTTATFVNAFAVVVIASLGHAFAVSVESSQDLEFDRTVGSLWLARHRIQISAARHGFAARPIRNSLGSSGLCLSYLTGQLATGRLRNLAPSVRCCLPVMRGALTGQTPCGIL
jgi:hypothetical protein